ncbi:hypothetical protein [Prevotella sp. S7-1-8]|jgi:hypothetical protein|uniref:hypothetical protein n=1 Tax=Prevotella sp. S7-1-8 TaxID=1284775 RepID=UPI0012E0502D|nr:hypothetical protein [Prevotella sp. S7-1-8]
MKRKYYKPSCTVIHTAPGEQILQNSDIHLKANDPVMPISEEKRVEEQEEEVEWELN